MDDDDDIKRRKAKGLLENAYQPSEKIKALEKELKLLKAAYEDAPTEPRETETHGKTPLDLTNALYCVGTLLIISSVIISLDVAFHTLHRFILLSFLVSLQVLSVMLGYFSKRRGNRVASIIFALLCIILTPFMLYALLHGLGLSFMPPDTEIINSMVIHPHWHFTVEAFGTLIVAIFMALFFPHPIMKLPILLTLWGIILALTAFNTPYGNTELYTNLAHVSLYYGLLLFPIAIIIDHITGHESDFPYWFYFVSVLAFWSGITFALSENQLSHLYYFLINLAILFIGIALMRKVFLLFATCGLLFYLTLLASTFFHGNILFPVCISLIGMFIVYLGSIWHEHEGKLTKKAQFLLPKSFKKVVHSRKRGH